MKSIAILQSQRTNKPHNAQQKYDIYFGDKMLFISNWKEFNRRPLRYNSPLRAESPSNLNETYIYRSIVGIEHNRTEQAMVSKKTIGMEAESLSCRLLPCFGLKHLILYKSKGHL